jgi:uncharacterized protein YegP (UPF0339 family)
MRIEIILKGFWKPKYSFQIRDNGGEIILTSKKLYDTTKEIDNIIQYIRTNIKTAKIINLALLLEE